MTGSSGNINRKKEMEMRAVRLHAPGGVESLSIDEVAVPEPGDGEVLVRVHAAALTRDELDWPTDRLPAIPSYEPAGVVEKIGSGVNAFTVGDPVFALTPFDRDGAAADYAVVPAAVLARKPDTLDDVESAALPMPGLTAWQALFDHGKLEAGERVLIHGATGGVGHIAMQLARWKGALAVGTARSPEGEGIVGRDDPVEPVDLVFDTSGGESLRRSPGQLRDGGRLVSVAEEPPEGTGTYFIVEPNGEQLAELARLADEGVLRPSVDSTFALAEAREAFERLAQPGKRGKVVLRVVRGG
jgi:NADPH:quinone reductase-like Zn-dependent oxidoreductase